MTDRYARQSVLAEVGEDGQLALANARVLLVGLGGLGSPAALYLAAAGVGHLGLVDADRVSVSNLQRQVLFTTADEGALKVEAGRQRLLALNPEITVRAYPEFFDAGNAEAIARDYDLLIDGSDNFATKELVNAVACRLRKPFVYGSVLRFEGRVGVFHPGRSACYHCLFPERPTHFIPNCAEAGVLGAMVGTIGSLQAMEAIKVILQNAGKSVQTLEGQVMVMGPQGVKVLRVSRDPDCPMCHLPPEDVVLPSVEIACVSDDVNLSEWDELQTKSAVLDVREEAEWARGIIPGAQTFALSRLLAGDLPDVPREKPLLLYCQSGIRSRQAMGVLKGLGWLDVRHLKGGYRDWFANRL